MKGLQEKTDDGIFLVIKHGGIVQESKNAREGFVPIEVPNVRTGEKVIKYIKRYKGVEALIKKIDWYDREYEDTRFMGWKLLLDANGVACTLTLPFESQVGSRFMKLAENIDYSQPVEFSAWKSPDDKTALSVKQNGENVPQKYTREDPGDCPAPVQGFNKKWNFDAQKQFLHERMISVVIPKVQAANQNGHTEAEQPAQENPSSNGNGTGTDGQINFAMIQSHLKDYATEQHVGVNDAIETWFGTRIWAEVEKLDPAIVKAQAAKLEEAVIPF